MLHKYWDASIKATSDSFSTILHGPSAHIWQRLRDEYNVGMTNSDLVRHVLNVSSYSVQAHLRGIGPYVVTMFSNQQSALELLDWPSTKTHLPDNKSRKLEEHVGTVLNESATNNLERIRCLLPKKSIAHVLGEAARLTLLADHAESDLDGPGYYVMDPFRHRPTSLYEILGIGRWAETGRPEQRKGMEP